MPYTPPAQQSPASSKTNSPNLSRKSSYSAENSGPRSPSSPRPNLPRSVSSTAYLNKQRRGPSGLQADALSFPHSPVDDGHSSTLDKRTGSAVSSNGSIHQSPSPLNNLLIPTGAILSPPDSSENSDGDGEAEQQQPSRGRELGRSWNELEQAVRSIELKRDPSPSRTEAPDMPSAATFREVSFSEPTTTIHSPTALSAEARKISHSRSSTETAIIIPERATYSECPTSSDSDDDDNELRIKPPLVRKKSGELVKPALRPSSRRRYSSMPGTPTYGKSVHFNDNGNQTRHFLQVDKPSAVSAGSSPVETYDSETEYPFDKVSSKVEWTIKLANFPEDTYERKSRPVRVERLFLSPDMKSLIGTVAVANIAFQKLVIARFTLDYWKTTSEICADYDNDVRRQNPSDGCDRFTFSIRLADQANLENKTLLLCMRYSAGGQDFWDNNDNMNYQVDFVKQMTKSASTTSLALPSSRPRHSIPRSRHSPPATVSTRDRAPHSDDDLASDFEGGSAYHFGSPDKIIGDSSNTAVKLKPRPKRADLFRAGSAPSTNGLGGRYDFGASLSAALSTAQDKLGGKSGLMHHAQSIPRAGANYFAQNPPKETKSASPDRPDSMTTDRPAMGSEQYKDLVSKFCYVVYSRRLGRL
ncbi:putative phosphatase regulatory subunit-domain-containing protein [Delphinella strobiligena]|nr:putative phosphatase regulatory subunit-domain-containing protein [Delphinella strobiligena]